MYAQSQPAGMAFFRTNKEVVEARDIYRAPAARAGRSLRGLGELDFISSIANAVGQAASGIAQAFVAPENAKTAAANAQAAIAIAQANAEAARLEAQSNKTMYIAGGAVALALVGAFVFTRK